MQFNNVEYEKLGELRSGHIFQTKDKVAHLGHLINKHKDWIHAIWNW